MYWREPDERPDLVAAEFDLAMIRYPKQIG